MKHYLFFILTLLTFNIAKLEAQTIPKFNKEYCNSEVYANLKGPEFTYIGEPKYSTLYFNVSKDMDNYKFGKEYYKTLAGANFKFTGILAPDKFKSSNPYTEVMEIYDTVIEFDSNIQSKVITDTCHVFWFQGHINYGHVNGESNRTFKKVDGSDITLEDFQFAYGLENVKIYAPKAKTEIDRFKKTATIQTEFKKNVMLRAWSDDQLSYKPIDIQIYVEIELSDWAHFDHAVSDDGKERELVKIGTDVRDCGSSVGCYVYETVGVTVPLTYVEQNKEGFEIQVYGNQKEIVKIPKYHISAILNAIGNIK